MVGTGSTAAPGSAHRITPNARVGEKRRALCCAPAERGHPGRCRSPAWTGRTAMRGSAPFGVLPEPVHGRPAGAQDRDVSVFRAQPQLRRGAAAREPLAMRAGHDPILASVQEKGRSDDVGGVEAPRSDAGEIVVDEPPMPPARARRTTSMNHDHSPARAASSSGVKSGSSSDWAKCFSSAARPAAAACSSASPPGPNPSNQSSPSAPYGAIPATTTTPRTRS
jgi:hypothetical protein